MRLGRISTAAPLADCVSTFFGSVLESAAAPASSDDESLVPQPPHQGKLYSTPLYHWFVDHNLGDVIHGHFGSLSDAGRCLDVLLQYVLMTVVVTIDGDAIEMKTTVKFTGDDREFVEKCMDSETVEQMKELGLFGATISEEYGGLGLSASTYSRIVSRICEVWMAPSGIFNSHLIMASCVERAGTQAQKEHFLPKFATGELRGGIGLTEPDAGSDLQGIRLVAKKDGDHYVLNGTKAVVVAAPWANKLIVSARISGDQRDSDGLGLFIVEKSAAGVSTQDYPTVDGNRASEVTLENVAVGGDALIGDASNGLALLEEALDYGIGAVCAEAIGHMKCLNDATVEYCKTRKQFGVPIGSFQVLQHRMVDMFMEYEQSVSMTYMVNMKLVEGEAERKKAAAGAKVQIGKSGRFVGQQAVQLHGGMGMTDELAVGHYFKRLTMIDSEFGNVDHHLKRYTELSAADVPAAAE